MDRWSDHDRKVFRWVVMPSSYLFGTLASVLLWRWFVVPLGVPRITFAQALGLDVLANLLIPTGSTAFRSDRWETWRDGAGHLWGAILFALVVGGAADRAPGPRGDGHRHRCDVGRRPAATHPR